MLCVFFNFTFDMPNHFQTFGDKKDDEKDDFFRGSSLASYIILNDNLRYHEEQYRKKIQFEFSHSGDFKHYIFSFMYFLIYKI